MRIDGGILVIGFGNPAREDDGIGPAVVAAIEGSVPNNVTLDSDYQLNVENAHDIAENDIVIFVDAAVEGDEPYSFKRVEPERSDSFSTHSVTPGAVIGMAHDLFGAKTVGFMLAVRGYSFRVFTEEMTKEALSNVKSAIGHLKKVLKTQVFEEVTGGRM